MPKLTAVATATPPHMVEQSTARDFAQQLFGRHFDNIDRLLPLFENAGIERRHFVVPPEWFEEPHSLEEKNELYIESATDLGERAARKLMTENNLEPADIDYIIYINTTGLATPSIDARLINRLGLERDIRRTPIWGLGCAGGAAGLSHAFHYLVGHPNHRVLVIAAELCGLTFMPDDFSKSSWRFFL